MSLSEVSRSSRGTIATLVPFRSVLGNTSHVPNFRTVLAHTLKIEKQSSAGLAESRAR